MSRLLAALVVLAILLAWSGPSAASPAFPDTIRRHYSVGCTVDCSFCHVGTPGLGTANTELATTLKARGLTAGSTASLEGALMAIDAEPAQQHLVTALKGCVNPSADAPVYGCATSPGRGGPDPLVLLLSVAVAVALCRRRSAG